MTACAVCGTTGHSRFADPPGWFRVGSASGVLVCSSDCAATVIEEIKKEEAEAWSTSS